MKLAMRSGHLAAEMRAIPGDLSVIVAEGDSHLAIVDHASKTVTIYAPNPKKTKAGSGKPIVPPAPAETAVEGADA